MPAVAVIPALVTALLPEGFAAAVGGGLLGAVGAAEAASATIIGATTVDRKSTRLNSSHSQQSRMPSSA